MPLEDIGKIAYGSAFVLGGIGVGYLTKRYIPKKFRPVGIVAALGLGTWGLYSIYQAFKEEEGEKPTPDLYFPISILDPSEGEVWSTLLPHTSNVQVSNPYNINYQIYVGSSLIYDVTGEVIDLPVQDLVLKAGEVKNLAWWLLPGEVVRGYGLYYLIVAVWDSYPSPTANRLSEAQVFFYFQFIG